MAILTVPISFNQQEISTNKILASKEVSPGVKLEIRWFDSYPCYPEDGHGRLHSFHVEAVLVVDSRKGTRLFKIEEIENDEF